MEQFFWKIISQWYFIKAFVMRQKHRNFMFVKVFSDKVTVVHDSRELIQCYLKWTLFTFSFAYLENSLTSFIPPLHFI